MADLISLNQLANASADANTLGDVINGNDQLDVISRLGAKYPTLAKAFRLMFQTGLIGATPKATYADMLNSGLSAGSYVVVTNDSDQNKVGIYQNINGTWTKLKINPADALAGQTYVVAMTNHIAVDVANKTVTYPDIIISKNGQDYKVVPYGKSLPFVTDGNMQTHYIDLSEPDVNNALKSMSGAQVPNLANAIILAVTINNQYNNFWVNSGNIEYFNNNDTTTTATSVQSTASIVKSITDKPIANLQKPTAKYDTKIVYGQSLASGAESYPSLSKVNKFGNLMLGDNVRPAQTDGNTYPTFGDATLKPLVASVTTADSTRILSDIEVANLKAGDFAYGEPINHGFVNASKFYLNQKLLTDNDTSRLFVTFNPAVEGKTIEQLSKNNTQDSINRYNRFIDGLQKIESATNGDSHVVDAIAWLQGEWNEYNNGGSWDKESYKSKLNRLIDDMQNDTLTITSQPLKPAFFTYQTGASYTNNVDSTGKQGLHVGMAQLELANQRNDTFLFSPIYPFTDKNGHLDSNGYRWVGNMLAKVYKQVVLDGKNWSPLQPIRTTKTGLKIRVDFYVPVPPLRFANPYVANTAQSYASKGFKVTDSNGNNIGITNVQAFDTYVEITLAQDITGGYVWYASSDTGGNGNLQDSDKTVAFDNYEYLPNSGMYASANIPELVGKPYPLNNWCVAFYLPIGYQYNF